MPCSALLWTILYTLAWLFTFQSDADPELLSGLFSAGIHLFCLDKVKVLLEHISAEQIGLVRHKVLHHQHARL